MSHVPHQAPTSATTTPILGFTRLDAIQLDYCAQNALSRALHELRSATTSYSLAEGHVLDALRALRAAQAISTSGRA
jgi:hypothetical protein